MICTEVFIFSGEGVGEIRVGAGIFVKDPEREEVEFELEDLEGEI